MPLTTISNTLPLSVPLAQALAHSNSKKLEYKRAQEKKLPDIILMTDVDHTLIPWKYGLYKKAVETDHLNGNREALKSIQERIIFALVTGLGWRSMKQISDQFEGFPTVDFLSTDNGKGELFFNHSGIEPKQWLEGLNPKSSLTEWDDFIKNIVKWDRSLVTQAIVETLKSIGFVDVPDDYLCTEYPHYIFLKKNFPESNNTSLTIEIDPDESSMYVRKEADIPKSFFEDLLKILANMISTRLEQAGNKVKFKMSEHDKYFYVFFSPNENIDINKASIFDFILETCPQDILNNLKNAISIGDSENDTHLKVPELFIPDSTHKIPVYSIHSGTSFSNNPDFMSHPRIEIAQTMGDLGSAIKNVIAKITT